MNRQVFIVENAYTAPYFRPVYHAAGEVQEPSLRSHFGWHVGPPEVEDRVMAGRWEGDFIKGAGNKSSVGVLVERTSRLVLLARMENATAASALAGFTAKLNAISVPLRQSLTYDQGSAAPVRTPTACFVSTCQREWTCPSIARKSSMRLPIA